VVYIIFSAGKSFWGRETGHLPKTNNFGKNLGGSKAFQAQ